MHKAPTESPHPDNGPAAPSNRRGRRNIPMYSLPRISWEGSELVFFLGLTCSGAHQKKGLRFAGWSCKKEKMTGEIKGGPICFHCPNKFWCCEKLKFMLQGEQTWNSHVNEIDDHLPNLHDTGGIQPEVKSLCCMVYTFFCRHVFCFGIIQYDFDI